MLATLNVQNLQNNDKTLHSIPADIQYAGQANVSAYFEKTITSEDSALSASLRGRPLNGKSMEVPAGYTGVIVTEARRPFTEDEERTLTANESFKSFNYWNLDSTPSEDDKLNQALKWIEIAKAVHQPISSNDSQGSLKSEISSDSQGSLKREISR